MGKRFDLNVAHELSATLLKTAEVMETESANIQADFKSLGETFKDKGYNEFQSDLNAADRTMSKIIEDIRELNRSVLDYCNEMSKLL